MRSRLFSLASIVPILAFSFQASAEDLIPLGRVPLPSPAKRYPVKNDQASIKEAHLKMLRDGAAASIEGSVKSIEYSTKGQPAIELDLGGDTRIWATWPLANTNGMATFLRVGERLRMLGWLRDSAAWSKVTRLDLPRQNPMTLLPICLVKVHNSDAIFDSKYVEYCEAWQKGYMPPDLAR